MGATLINGVNYSWADIKLVLFGQPINGVTQINYSAKQTKDNNYGAGSKPVSRGYGNVEFEGSIEMYRDEWMKIIAISPNGNPNELGPFSIQIIYGGSRVTAQTDVLKMVEFTVDENKAKQGDTKLLVTVPLIIGDIQHL